MKASASTAGPAPVGAKLAESFTSARWMHRVSQQHITIIINGFDQNLRLADGEVIEAILPLAVPILRLLRIWRGLGRNATATSRHDACYSHVVLGIVIRKPQLLVMSVSGHKQIHTQITQGLVEVLLMSAREVCDHNLPAGLTLSHELRDPWLLLRPKRGEPARAGVN